MSRPSGPGVAPQLAAIASVLAVLPLLAPLMRDQSWVGPTAVGILAVGAVGIASRALGAASLVTHLVQLVVLSLWSGALVASDAAVLGLIPTPDWAVQVWAALGEGVGVATDDPAPVAVTDPVVLVTATALGLVAVGVDVLSVSLRRAALAGVVLGSVAIWSSLIVDGPPRWWATVTAAAGFLTLLAVSTSADQGADDLLLVDDGRAEATSGRARLVAAVGIAVTAIGGALLAPTVLPSKEFATLSIGEGNGSGREIATINPIVDLRRDLLRPDNIPVLHYRSTAAQPEYLRLVSLDTFDGAAWFTAPRSVPIDNRVETGMPPPPGLTDPSVRTGQAEYSIVVSESLESDWLPLPYPTLAIDIDGDWRFDAGSLDVVGASGGTKGVAYQVEALELTPRGNDLSGPAVTGPGADTPAADPNLTAVPASVRAELDELTARVTAGAETEHEAAIAIQGWFRENFAYDIAGTPAGSDIDALRDFLRDRRGYCEQYAATMALMARVAGIPARVAVGYRPGTSVNDEQDGVPPVAGDGSLREVRAHDSHAWPELYFEGAGWLRFEPTPSGVSGVAPAYSVPADEVTTAPEQAEPDRAETPVQTPENPRGVEDQTIATETGEGFSLVPVALAFLAFVTLGPPAIGGLRRRWRWQRASADPAEQAWCAMDDVGKSAAVARAAWPAAATPREAGRVLIGSAILNREQAQAVDALVREVELAWFGTDVGVSDIDASPPTDQTLWDRTQDVRTVLASLSSWHRRGFGWWWPGNDRPRPTNGAGEDLGRWSRSGGVSDPSRRVDDANGLPLVS